jgi:hypothetical protein
MHKWVEGWNADRPIEEQIQPFGFLNVYSARAPELAQYATASRPKANQVGESGAADPIQSAVLEFGQRSRA